MLGSRGLRPGCAGPLFPQPALHALANRRSVEQAQMGAVVLHMGMRRLEGQRSARIPVLAQGAWHGYQAITLKAREVCICSFCPAGGDSVTAQVFGKGQDGSGIAVAGEAMPASAVAGQEVAIAQIGYAGAADTSQAGKGLGVGQGCDKGMEMVADALHGRAVVRAAQKDQFTQGADPGMAALPGLRDAASRDESTHAEADQIQRPHRNGPGPQQLLKLLAQQRTVLVNGQPAVVGQVKRCHVERGCQFFAIISLRLTPVVVAHAQTVHQEKYVAFCLGKGLAKAGGIGAQHLLPGSDLHGQAQRVFRALQVIADDAMQDGQEGILLFSADAGWDAGWVAGPVVGLELAGCPSQGQAQATAGYADALKAQGGYGADPVLHRGGGKEARMHNAMKQFLRYMGYLRNAVAKQVGESAQFGEVQLRVAVVLRG